MCSCVCALYCSECVGCSTDNTVLCSSCLTGSCFFAGATETPTPGNCLAACTAPPDAPCLGTPCAITTATPPQCLPCNNPDLPPCSPKSCGTTCQPPQARSGGGGSSSGGGPVGGGSGGGSAKSAGGQPRSTIGCAATKLSQAMNRFGSGIASLFSGGTPVGTGKIVPGQKAPRFLSTLTPNTFGLVVLIIGGLLLFMAFGHAKGPERG